MPSPRARRPAILGVALLASSMGIGKVFASDENAATAGDSLGEIARVKDATVSTGANLRSRWEWTESDEHQVVGLHRLLAHASAEGGALRGAVELGVHLANPRGDLSSQTARNGLDIQQAFVDFGDAQPGPALRQRLRAGRQELVYEFLGWRDAPNVRRAWDGVRFTSRWSGWTSDLFVLRPVEPGAGAFDDSAHGSTHLAGAHLQSAEDSSLSFSAFFYDVAQARWQTSRTAAAARTSTLGGVASLRFNSYEASLGGAGQRGHHGDRALEAWYGEAEIGRRFPVAHVSPKIALRVSAFSGGAPDARRVRTFNPLFPNYAYSTEAALQTPSNLIKVAAIAEAGSEERLQWEYRAESLWRYSSRDAFYLPAGNAPLQPDSDRRWAGFQQQLKLTYAVKRDVRIVAAYVNFNAARSLHAAGASDVNFLLLQMEMRL